MRVCLFLIFLALVSNKAYSQKQCKIDSLRQLLTDTKNVEESVGLNEQLFVAYLYTSPDSADHYRKNIKRISENNNYIDGQYLYHSLSGRYHFAKSDIDSAFYHIEKASTIAEKLQNKLYLADCYKKIGVIYNVRRNDSLSTKYAHMALENAKQTDDWRILSSIYILLGNQNFMQTAYPEALTYYLKLDSIYTSQNKVDKSLAAAYNNIGMIYSELRNPKAVDYIKKSIEIYEGLGLEEGARYGDVALATYYDFLQEDKVAINHLLKAKKYYEEYGDKNMLGHIYGRLGSCYLQLNDFENAELYLIKVSSMPEASQDKSIKVSNQIGLGDLYSHKKQHQKAVAHFKNALELLQENDGNDAKDLQLFNIYKGLYGTYKDNNDYKNALNALEKKMELEASIQKSQNELEVEELNKKYQTDKQQQEIELLTSQSQLTEAKAKNQRSWLVAGISILGLAFVTLFFLFRNKQKTNQRLKELESAKSKFFANISHEFRTPLTLISGPVAHQLSKDGLSTDDKTDLNLIQRNANRLLNLVNQLLELSKIEVGHRKLMVSKGNLELFLKYLVEPFQYQAQRKGMVFKSEVMVPSEAWFDRDILEKVVANLLSNAIKYNKEGGVIGFDVNMKNQYVTLAVSNENEELSEKELPQLFDRFYQNNMLNPGVGIGLSLVKELVHLSKGSIVASKPNRVTILFTVTLPITKGAFSNKDIVMTNEFEGNFENAKIESIALDDPIAEFEDNNLPVMLVIDDNEEIRLFIKTLFKKEYQILEAPNGEEGIKVAFKAVPDLIISDIMMPVKDGIQLSNVLKNDERTSHIPIILLTAKSGEENELTGLKAGADAYLVKPFKEEKLRVIIKRLVATGEAIREKLNKQVILKPQEIELTDPDSLLLKRIQQILDDNLTNSEFNTASFCDQVGLSRMHLHRKLKALTGYAASEFIRVQRLKMAAKLLKDGHTHISEVGYAVGFNQPAYFSTAFKQHFGCSPSEYMDN